MKRDKIIQIWKPFLWSYDVSQMNFSKDKERIITSVLNFGTHEATRLLFKVYPLTEISNVVKHPFPGEWNKKSLNFWSLMLGVKPRLQPRKISNS